MQAQMMRPHVRLSHYPRGSRDIPMYDYLLRSFCRTTRRKPHAMEPAMKRSLAVMMAVLMIGISLMLSACGRSLEPGTLVYDPGTPVLEPGQPYGSVDLAGWR